jgi:hypothetical protein
MGENMQAHVQSVRNLPISLHRGDVRSVAETLNVGNVRRLAAINHNLVQNDMFCMRGALHQWCSRVATWHYILQLNSLSL